MLKIVEVNLSEAIEEVRFLENLQRLKIINDEEAFLLTEYFAERNAKKFCENLFDNKK